jgi:hypothetical protein
MLQCEQTKGQSVYQHGVSVAEHFAQLIESPDLPEWRLPSWFLPHREKLRANLHDRETYTNYQLFHDCGKPFCRVVDADGKVHFPDHANVSRQVYLETTGDETTANLIGWDMCLHTEKAEEIALRLNGGYFAGVDKGWEKGYRPWTIKDACTLLLTALAELHSNSRLFGGIESVSFKMKFKTIEKRGKQICKHYFEKENDNAK